MSSSPKDISDVGLTVIYFPYDRSNKVSSGHPREIQLRNKVLKISPKIKQKPNYENENSNARYSLFARKMHHLGIRPMFEFFKEVRDGAPFESTLERYAGLVKYSEFIQVNGGKDLPANARLIINNVQKSKHKVDNKIISNDLNRIGVKNET
jgi:hypothetical protein